MVLLSHDPRFDEPATGFALRSPAPYVGAIGSRKVQEKRRGRLREAGFSEADLSRLHGPIGLDLGAASPWRSPWRSSRRSPRYDTGRAPDRCSAADTPGRHVAIADWCGRLHGTVMARDLLAAVQQALGTLYTLEREVGRGGGARVFLARNTEGTEVALKVLHPELAVTVAADRFLREVRLCSRLDHPNIARLLDSGEADWVVFYAMSYCPGPTLREGITRARTLPVDDVKRLGADLLSALQHAHEHSIVHRDVKPENIVVSNGRTILLDFGIAKAISDAAGENLTRSGVALGTCTYMSPEQIRGLRDIDHRSDLYSLACVLFECLTGRPPFVHKVEGIVLQKHLTEVPPRVESLRADTPKVLADVIDRALAKEPVDRWASAAAMRRHSSADPTPPRLPVARTLPYYSCAWRDVPPLM